MHFEWQHSRIVIRNESRNRRAFITLCRAEKRNAFSRQTVTELKAAFGRAETDDEVRAVILRAEGKAFSAGADLAYLQSLQNFSYEERITKLNLNQDRADVIIPATRIYLSAMKWSGAKDIYVPKIGLSDGIIKSMYYQTVSSVTV